MAPTPRSSNWGDRLEAARSVPDVVDLCHEFVTQCPPADLARLPLGLQPPQRMDVATISSYAVELVKHDLGTRGTHSTLKAFAVFFGEASAGLARIAMARARRDGWAYASMRR
jgi:hypothetical protein